MVDGHLLRWTPTTWPTHLCGTPPQSYSTAQQKTRLPGWHSGELGLPQPTKALNCLPLCRCFVVVDTKTAIQLEWAAQHCLKYELFSFIFAGFRRTTLVCGQCTATLTGECSACVLTAARGSTKLKPY